MSDKTFYTVKLKRYDVNKAVNKLIREETGYCPEEDHHMLEHTFFYNIKLEEAEFECDEGDIEWTFKFSDDGSLKRWGE